jgi:ornithine cyclodeaminase
VLIIGGDELSRLFAFPDLIAALRAAFARPFVTPARHHHTLRRSGEPDAILLLMPAWDDPGAADAHEAFVGVKIVSVNPGNAARGRPTVNGSYLLMSGLTGETLAIMDGNVLTNWRTAAASALAASYLARPDASRLLMIGAGALAPYLIDAHASVRPIAEVLVWNRNPSRAGELAARMADRPYSVRATAELEQAVGAADVVSCATLSTEPLVRGAWLQPGTHVDLVGAFTPAMRESDDAAIAGASVYVDTRAGAWREAGDLIQAAGVIGEADIRGDLCDLCRGTVRGRERHDEITIFKSVGTAVEDLAAAVLAYSRAGERRT